MMLVRGLVISALVHGSLFAGSMQFITWQKARRDFVAEIDLKSSSLLLRPGRRQAASAVAAAPEPWVLPAHHPAQPPFAPRRKPVPGPKPQAVDEALAVSNSSVAGATADASATAWVPAAAASRAPVWLEGMISEEDYPSHARASGREGKVVAHVCIDATGRVQDVQIREGSDPEFGQVILERLPHARFQPGLDENGRPIAVRMTIPVVFRLDG